jgi:hypothetical protein
MFRRQPAEHVVGFVPLDVRRAPRAPARVPHEFIFDLDVLRRETESGSVLGALGGAGQLLDQVLQSRRLQAQDLQAVDDVRRVGRQEWHVVGGSCVLYGFEHFRPQVCEGRRRVLEAVLCLDRVQDRRDVLVFFLFLRWDVLRRVDGRFLLDFCLGGFVCRSSTGYVSASGG